jgi:EpsI family protein
VSVEGKIISGEAALPDGSPSPASLNRRHVLMGGALLAVSGLAFARAPKARYSNIDAKHFEALFPQAFGDWRTLPVSELVMPPESDLANKMYQHILTRTYVNKAGVGVMFLAAYNSVQLNNVQLHRPEFCYYASGFSIDLSEPYDIKLAPDRVITARAVRASQDTRIENIIYWTRIGEDMPQSWAGQRIAMTKANLEGYLADGMLLRVSVINPDFKESMDQLSGFVRDMIAHTKTPTHKLMTGFA